jgi:hypothetical protein
MIVPRNYNDEDFYLFFNSDANAKLLCVCVISEENINMIKYISNLINLFLEEHEYTVNHISNLPECNKNKLHYTNKIFLNYNYANIKDKHNEQRMNENHMRDKSEIDDKEIVRFDNQAYKSYFYGNNGELEKKMFSNIKTTPQVLSYDGRRDKLAKKIAKLLKPKRMDGIDEHIFDSTINYRTKSSSHLYNSLKSKYSIN